MRFSKSVRHNGYQRPLQSPTNIHTFFVFQFSHTPSTLPKPDERFLDATVQNSGFGEGILTPAESRGGGAGTQALYPCSL